MAYKVFVNGDGLSASELNTYLMKQAVISFASAGARDAALTSPLEGQLVWLEDENAYVYYNGTGTWSYLDGGWSDISANYAVVAGDKNKTIRSTSTAITVTINNVLTRQGDRIDFIQGGTGQITFTAGSGVTLLAAGSATKTGRQYAGASVVFAGSGVYYLIGNIV